MEHTEVGSNRITETLWLGKMLFMGAVLAGHTLRDQVVTASAGQVEQSRRSETLAVEIVVHQILRFQESGSGFFEEISLTFLHEIDPCLR